MKDIKNICDILSLILFISVIGGIDSLQAQSAKVEIEVTGLRNNNGKVLLAIYTSEAGYPNDPVKAEKGLSSSITNGKATFYFELKSGKYAISVLHDENNNQKMDTNFLGLPKEGVGATNNATGFMGPPSFKDASFIMDESGFRQSIEMTYF